MSSTAITLTAIASSAGRMADDERPLLVLPCPAVASDDDGAAILMEGLISINSDNFDDQKWSNELGVEEEEEDGPLSLEGWLR
uniref:Uncharacterized protein n=1 Tax=Oryza punctata TaxID=4537 RepID=A0A0E0KR82_ORYPU